MAAKERLSPTSSDQPLLVLRYRDHQQFLRIALFLLVHLFMGLYLIFMIFNLDEMLFNQPFIGIASIVMFPLTGFVLFDFLLFEEIRLYKDRIVKEWHMLGTAEVRLEDAKYSGNDYGYMGARCLRNPNTRRYLNNFKIVLFDPYMIDPKDLEEFNKLLAELSGRNVKEFQGKHVSFERLMKEG